MLTTPTFVSHRQEIAGLPIADLAKQFGTPCYFYDLEKIYQRIDDLAAFDTVRYAQKALSNIAILDRVRKRGVVVDAVSAGEIERALRAGFDPRSTPAGVVYTADVFDDAALDLIQQHGIAVNVGSPDMIDQLGSRGPGGEIAIRINPGFGHGHSQKTNTGGPQSKHGVWFSDLDDCLERAERFGLQVTGLHMHIGSGTDLEHLSQVCGAMEQASAKVLDTLKVISAGGGLPVPYKDDQQYVDLQQYYRLWDETRQRVAQRCGREIELEIEPGRYLVAESGFLLAEIRAVKTMGDNLFYLLDAGFNDLARPILYGSYHPISVARRDGETTPLQPVVLGGPLCESGDIFTQTEGGYVDSRDLPQAKVGDWVVIEVAGAYAFAMASNYNSRYRAAEVLIEDGQAKLVRRRENSDDLLRLESIPD